MTLTPEEVAEWTRAPGWTPEIERASIERYAGRTHGRVSCYNAGCRCAPCTAAKTEARRRGRARSAVEEDRVREGLELLRETLAERDEAGREVWGLRTIGEVIRTQPGARHCVFGKPQHLSNISKGQIRHAYRRCLGARCPHCAPDYVATRLRAVCKAWKDQPVWVTRFADTADWSRRGKPLRGQYRDGNGKKLYFSIRVGAEEDEAILVFTPGEAAVGECVPVENVGRTLVATLFNAPADRRGVKRHFGLRVTPEKEPTGWWVLDLIDYKTANQIAELTLGRALNPDQKDTIWRGLHEYSHSISGVTEEEILQVREALIDWCGDGDNEPAYALGATA